MCETHRIKVWILHSGDTTGFSCGSKSQQQLALFFVSVLPKVFKYGHLRPCRQPVKYRQHVTLLIWTPRPQHVLCRDKGASLRAALRGEERREAVQQSQRKKRPYPESQRGVEHSLNGFPRSGFRLSLTPQVYCCLPSLRPCRSAARAAWHSSWRAARWQCAARAAGTTTSPSPARQWSAPQTLLQMGEKGIISPWWRQENHFI